MERRRICEVCGIGTKLFILKQGCPIRVPPVCFKVGCGHICKLCTFLWRCDPTRVMASSFLRFLDYTQRRTTVGRTPLDEWSARRRDLYLTTHNTHNRQTSVPLLGFELTISAGERPRTYALDREATGTGKLCTHCSKIRVYHNLGGQGYHLLWINTCS
jgi:hypothetical protein